MDILEFTFYGEPVPAMRPRLGRNGTYNDPKYSDYKRALAEAIKAEFGFWAWGIPPAEETTARKKYLKNHRYALSLAVYRTNDRGDLSNFVKCVEDALQDAGVFANDSQIDSYLEPFFKTIDKENPRIELKLIRL